MATAEGIGEEGPRALLLLGAGDVKMERPSLGLASSRGLAAARARGGRAGSCFIDVVWMGGEGGSVHGLYE